MSSITDSKTYIAGKKWYTQSVVCCGVALGSLSSNPSPFLMSADGGLTIRAQKSSSGGWTTGTLATVPGNDGDPTHGFTKYLGYFEIKMKVPFGASAWPAFWLINDYCINWNPSCTYGGVRAFENDVIEQYNTEAFQHITLHLYNPHVVPSQQPYTPFPAMGDGNYHTFGVLWNATTLTYYSDGAKVYQTPNPGMNGPAFIIINLGMGPSGVAADAKNPSDFKIKYVRAWDISS